MVQPANSLEWKLYQLSEVFSMPHLSIRTILIVSLLLLATTPVNAQDNALAAKLADMANREFQERNTLHQALTHINQAIKLDQKSGNNYYIRAEIYKRMEEDEMALNDINRAVELVPTQAYFYECKANILLTLKQNKQALEAADMAVRLKPDSITRTTRAMVLIAMGKFQEAKAVFDKLVEENKSDFRARMRRVPVNKKLNCWQPIVEDMSFLMKIDNKNSFSYKTHFLERGIAYLKLKQYDKAEQDLKFALKVMPDNREVHQALLELYKTSKRAKEARAEESYLNEMDEDIKPFK